MTTKNRKGKATITTTTTTTTATPEATTTTATPEATTTTATPEATTTTTTTTATPAYVARVRGYAASNPRVIASPAGSGGDDVVADLSIVEGIPTLGYLMTFTPSTAEPLDGHTLTHAATSADGTRHTYRVAGRKGGIVFRSTAAGWLRMVAGGGEVPAMLRTSLPLVSSIGPRVAPWSTLTPLRSRMGKDVEVPVREDAVMLA